MSSSKSVPFVIPPVAEISCFVGPSQTGAVRTDGLAGRMGLAKLDDSDKNYRWFRVENNSGVTETTYKIHIYLLIITNMFYLKITEWEWFILEREKMVWQQGTIFWPELWCSYKGPDNVKWGLEIGRVLHVGGVTHKVTLSMYKINYFIVFLLTLQLIQHAFLLKRLHSGLKLN